MPNNDAVLHKESQKFRTWGKMFALFPSKEKVHHSKSSYKNLTGLYSKCVCFSVSLSSYL